jgi:hypothetical protein
MSLAQVEAAAVAQGLIVMGALHPRVARARNLRDGTLILLGAGGGFWVAFSASPEALDSQANPVDRWSKRVIGALAARFAARAHYPFGGPPHTPFIDWALKSGRAFQSPVGMLVHDTVGLMISYRGALHLGAEIPIPPTDGQNPCDTCTDQPCAATCPVSALRKAGAYDLTACRSYLDSAAGAACMGMGCAARRACPLSAGAARQPEQSALHMRAFHNR